MACSKHAFMQNVTSHSNTHTHTRDLLDQQSEIHTRMTKLLLKRKGFIFFVDCVTWNAFVAEWLQRMPLYCNAPGSIPASGPLLLCHAPLSPPHF